MRTTEEENNMKAIIQDSHGLSEVLEFRDIDKPMVGDDDVVVRVHAASVNPGDWGVMRGMPSARLAPTT